VAPLQSTLTLVLLAVAAASPQDVPRFPAETRVVALHVVVTDRDGRLLEDLRPSEVQVLENGRACEIGSFRLIRTTRHREGAAGRESAAEEPAPLPSSSSARRANLVVLLFDPLTIETAPLARRGALDFLSRGIPDDTWFAVFTVGDQRFQAPFTTDLTAVRSAVEAATLGVTRKAGGAGEASPTPQGKQAGSEALESEAESLRLDTRKARAITSAERTGPSTSPRCPSSSSTPGTSLASRSRKAACGGSVTRRLSRSGSRRPSGRRSSRHPRATPCPPVAASGSTPRAAQSSGARSSSASGLHSRRPRSRRTTRCSEASGCGCRAR
jgi:hypothetical protein